MGEMSEFLFRANICAPNA